MIGHKDFPSRSGGVEVMVGGLARSLVERGYDVTVYNRGLEKHHNVYDVDGVHARRVFTLQKPALNATIYSFLATFDALFRGYDVLHYHAIGPSVPLLIAKIFGKHTVCTYSARTKLEGGQVARLCKPLYEAGRADRRKICG